MIKDSISNRFKELQLKIVEELKQLDGNIEFITDLWERREGGGGRTMVASNGNVLEKGGVAFSSVHGDVSDVMKKQLNLDGDVFFATGVSIVLHPFNPFVPIIHMNIRYFELSDGTYWFGGGIDLTPHYINERMAKQFHLELKNICSKYNENFYTTFKLQADDYFFIPHRNETRGVSGIFFDHLDEKSGISKDAILNFCIDLGENFASIYSNQVNFGRDQEFNEKNVQWRNHRRGRYVEFNLVNDRGTKFGLFSGGRTESILMSLPPMAQWTYCHPIEENSEEEKTQVLLKKGVDWLSYSD
jgi:coproporphyrinogen III oxidase